MKTFMMRARVILSFVSTKVVALWKKYRGLKNWQQIVIGIAAAVVLIGGTSLLHSLGKTQAAEDTYRTVMLETVGSLSGGAEGGSVIGSVRSVAEADILAESAGTVRVVRTTLGSTVAGGAVLAELENAAQRAAVLQAEGAYDAAVAARRAVSPTDTTVSVRNAYQAAFTALDYAIETQIDSFYGDPTPYGPRFLITDTRHDQSYFPQLRNALTRSMTTWRTNLNTANTTDPEQLLNEAESVTAQINTLLVEIAASANRTDSQATATQLGNLASARATVAQQAALLAAARETYRGKSVSTTASVDASVKQALGVLRGAQAQLEKTIIRAPIAGTVNFLPIRVGDYVTAYQHVATVAQNGSLEVVAYVSETEREQLAAGAKVLIDGLYEGVVTRIAPALDPQTRQIEVHIAVTGQAEKLVNGQSVRVALPGASAKSPDAAGPIMLPLAAVKLRAEDRVVFTVDESGRIVAHLVTIGDVHGDRIEVLSGITTDMRIVTDARGLSEGEKVTVGSSTSL